MTGREAAQAYCDDPRHDNPNVLTRTILNDHFERALAASPSDVVGVELCKWCNDGCGWYTSYQGGVARWRNCDACNSDAVTKPDPQKQNTRTKAIAAMSAYLEGAGVPLTEFDPEFVVRMMAAMMVSFHKYGRVGEAYPAKFDAVSDVRARMAKYRETGNRHFLVDAANFAMIEAMHPGRKGGSEWAGNDAADSPGRTTSNGHRLVQEDNAGNRIMGETILHHPDDDAALSAHQDARS